MLISMPHRIPRTADADGFAPPPIVDAAIIDAAAGIRQQLRFILLRHAAMPLYDALFSLRYARFMPLMPMLDYYADSLMPLPLFKMHASRRYYFAATC